MGFHREVEIAEDYVIKRARNKISVYCNKTEVERSGSSEYLAKVIETSDDFKVIKMERVDIPSLRTRLRYARLLKRQLKGLSDIHWYNIGEKNGIPMLYDYGDTLVIWRILFRKLRNCCKRYHD
jgi:hypothetical protein